MRTCACLYRINRWVSLLFLLWDSRVSPWLIPVSFVALRTFDGIFFGVSVLYFLLLFGTLVVPGRFLEVDFLLCGGVARGVLLLLPDLGLGRVLGSFSDKCAGKPSTSTTSSDVEPLSSLLSLFFCVNCCFTRSCHSRFVVWNLERVLARKVMILFVDFTLTTNEIR